MKSRLKKYLTRGVLAILLGVGLASCEGFEFPVDLSFQRLFSPVTFNAATVTATGVTFNFSKVAGANSYVIELSKDSLQFAAIEKTINVSIDTLSLIDGSTNVYAVKVFNLDGGTRYSARIKAVTADNKVPESKYDQLLFVTKTEQIFKAIIPVEKTDISVILHWDATGADVTHLIITNTTDNSTVQIDLQDADKSSSKKLIEGLSGATVYTARIYNKLNVRGELTFRTNESVPSAGTILRLVGGEDLVELLKTQSGDVTVVLPMGSVYKPTWIDPLTATTVFSLPIPDQITGLTFWGTEGGVQPALNTTTVKLGAGITKLKFKNIDLYGNSNAADYVLNESLTRSISEITFSDCNVHTFRGVVRLQNDANYTVLDRVSFERCLIHDLGGYSVTSTSALNVKLNNLSITESTLYNITDAMGNFKNIATSILVDKCTFYNCFGNGKYLFNFNTTFIPTSLVISNCIFGKFNSLVFDGTQSVRGTSPKITTVIAVDSYRTTDFIVNSGYPITGLQDYLKSSTDLFVDPVNYNFKIKDSSFPGATTAGDPRWLQ